MKNEQGFTLIEVIISIAFLSIVCVVFLQMFIKADELGERSASLDDSVIYSTSVVETMKGLQSEDAIEAWASVEAFDVQASDTGMVLTRVVTDLEYTYTLTLIKETSDGSAGLYDLACTVYNEKEEADIHTLSTRLVLER